MAPTSVFLSSGSPTGGCPSAASACEDLLVHRLLDEEPRAGAAHVTLVEVDPVDDPLDRLIERRASKMTLAALPPSSSVSFFPLPATARMISLPTSVDPVKAILSTSSCSRPAPARPSPVTMLTTPAGSSAWRSTSQKRSAVSGVVSAGLRTTVFPRRAGAIFQESMRSGKFQGMICPATPSGRGRGSGRRTRACRPSPRSRRSAPPRGRSTSRDSRIGLPPSSDSSTANSRERSCRMRAIGRGTWRARWGRARTSRSRTRHAPSARRGRRPRPRVRDLGERLLVARSDARRVLAGAGSTHSPPMKSP